MKEAKKPIQIYIERQQDDALAALARGRGVSKAAIIRESLERYLAEIPVDDDPAMGIVGIGNSGPEDLSEQHDKYLAAHVRNKAK